MNENVKKYVFNFITLIVVIFSLLSLLFPLLDVKIEVNLIGEISNNSAVSGFDFISNITQVLNESWIYKFAGIVCLVQLIISIILILGNLFVSFAFDEDNVKKISIISMVIVTILSILLLVTGILLVSVMKNSIGEILKISDYNSAISSIKITTLSYIPIIINVVLMLVFFIFNMISKLECFGSKKTSNDRKNNSQTNYYEDASTAKMLVRYKELYDQGIITQAEYLQLRSKLLSK